MALLLIWCSGARLQADVVERVPFPPVVVSQVAQQRLGSADPAALVGDLDVAVSDAPGLGGQAGARRVAGEAQRQAGALAGPGDDGADGPGADRRADVAVAVDAAKRLALAEARGLLPGEPGPDRAGDAVDAVRDGDRLGVGAGLAPAAVHEQAAAL